MDSVTGKVNHVHSSARTAIFEWRIRDFSKLLRVDNRSPTVTYFNMDWYLEIFKGGDGICCVFLYRELLTPEIHLTITCETSDGEQRDVARNKAFKKDSHWFDREFFTPLIIPPSTGVILTCSLRKPHAPEHKSTQTSFCMNAGLSLAILSQDLRKGMEDGLNTDIEIKCGDSVIPAHRFVLASRSEVLRAMLEGQDRTVEIADVEPEILDRMIQYIYTGILPELGEATAAPLYEASAKYKLQALREACGEFLARKPNSFKVTDWGRHPFFENQQKLMY